MVEKIFPANCIPSPESPEKRTTTWSNSFTSNSSDIIVALRLFIVRTKAKVKQIKDSYKFLGRNFKKSKFFNELEAKEHISAINLCIKNAKDGGENLITTDENQTQISNKGAK